MRVSKLALMAAGAAVAGFLTISTAGAFAKGAPPIPIACSVAEAAAASFQQSGGVAPLLLSHRPPALPYGVDEANFFRRDWTGQTPKLATAIKFTKAKLRSSLDCQGVQALFVQKTYRVLDESEAAAILKTLPGASGPTHIWEVSEPIVLGGEAMVFFSERSNALSGYSYVVLLKKKAGSWVVVGRKAVSLS